MRRKCLSTFLLIEQFQTINHQVRFHGQGWPICMNESLTNMSDARKVFPILN